MGADGLNSAGSEPGAETWLRADAQVIAAVATASGRAGIGVVRVSGDNLSPIIAAVCGRALSPRHATYLPFLAADGSVIDQGLALHFPAPHSYTGQDVLELQGHGGPVVMQLLLRRVLEAGQTIDARMAQPGEFTLRAFLNDKIDLAQAEAIADLIDASTEQAARSASRSLSGEFSKAVHELRDGLVRLRMLVEATLDFPEEEIDFLQADRALEQLAEIRAGVVTLLARAQQGALLRDGLNVVLAGQPNVGKSSLLNALAGAEVAIVTPIAGTTRDKVTQTIQVEGIALNIIDTAGLRDSDDPVERIGIERTWQELGRADVVLHLMEAGEGHGGHAIDAKIVSRLPAQAAIVSVFNKIDVPQMLAKVVVTPERRQVWLSAKTGEGIELLRGQLLELAGWQSSGESLFIARERHVLALTAVRDGLVRAQQFAEQGAAQLDLFAEELRLAQVELSKITGEFTADDLLGVIFSQFCIGK